MNITRKLQLLRGRWMCLRGVTAGRRFGLGRFVEIHSPQYLTAGDDVSIGDFGYLFCCKQGVRLGSHCSIDRHLWLHCGCTSLDAEHSIFELGEYSFIGCNAVIGAGGGIRIGKHVLIGQSVNIHAESHVFDDPSRLIREQGIHYQGIVIEDDVWVGSKVTILDGVKIGRGAIVAAGAVVTRSVPSMTIAAGIPARIIKHRVLEH